MPSVPESTCLSKNLTRIGDCPHEWPVWVKTSDRVGSTDAERARRLTPNLHRRPWLAFRARVPAAPCGRLRHSEPSLGQARGFEPSSHRAMVPRSPRSSSFLSPLKIKRRQSQRGRAGALKRPGHVNKCPTNSARRKSKLISPVPPKSSRKRNSGYSRRNPERLAISRDAGIVRGTARGVTIRRSVPRKIRIKTPEQLLLAVYANCV